MSDNSQKLRKIVFAGNAGVGKTSIMFVFLVMWNVIIYRYRQAQRYIAEDPTISLDFLKVDVKVDDVVVPCQLWDTLGQEKYRSVEETLFAQIAVL